MSNFGLGYQEAIQKQPFNTRDWDISSDNYCSYLLGYTKGFFEEKGEKLCM